jgi:hypothetical protein
VLLGSSLDTDERFLFSDWASYKGWVGITNPYTSEPVIYTIMQCLIAIAGVVFFSGARFLVGRAVHIRTAGALICAVIFTHLTIAPMKPRMDDLLMQYNGACVQIAETACLYAVTGIGRTIDAPYGAKADA